jgi:hypothetical protein
MIIVNGVLFIKLIYVLRPIDIPPYVYTITYKHIPMSEKKQVLTSVKIDMDLFDKFKIECIKRKFSFQKISERAIHLYLTSEEFRKQIHNHNDLSLESED